MCMVWLISLHTNTKKTTKRTSNKATEITTGKKPKSVERKKGMEKSNTLEKLIIVLYPAFNMQYVKRCTYLYKDWYVRNQRDPVKLTHTHMEIVLLSHFMPFSIFSNDI